jgi:hypothetical protein
MDTKVLSLNLDSSRSTDGEKVDADGEKVDADGPLTTY